MKKGYKVDEEEEQGAGVQQREREEQRLHHIRHFDVCSRLQGDGFVSSLYYIHIPHTRGRARW